MEPEIVDLSTVYYHHHRDDRPHHWDGQCQNDPPSITPWAALPNDTLKYNLSTELPLEPMVSLSSIGFVSPDLLQPFSITSTSSVSPPAVEEEIIITTNKTKRRRHDTTNDDINHKNTTHLTTRERNRNAAAKCRAKGKAAEEVLKEKKRIEYEKNRVLRITFEELKHEALMLKHELFYHSSCNSPIIDNYIKHSAAQFTKNMNTSPAL